MRTALLVALLLLPLSALAEEQKKEGGLNLHPKHGPAKINLGHDITLDLPDGYVFLDSTDAAKFQKANGNPDDKEVAGIVAKKGENWFVIARYTDAGYVKDDEAGKLDADEILKSIREGTEEANKYRKEQGFEPVEVVGWSEAPHYDKSVHHVIWAIEGSDSHGHIANLNTRILGRRGYISMNLVASTEELPGARPDVTTLLAATTFASGARYEDFDSAHDKVAEFGLAALVAGGAGAAALKIAKVGLLAKFGKGILALLIAGKKAVVLFFAGIAAAIKKFFGKKDEQPRAEPPTVA